LYLDEASLVGVLTSKTLALPLGAWCARGGLSVSPSSASSKFCSGLSFFKNNMVHDIKLKSLVHVKVTWLEYLGTGSTSSLLQLFLPAAPFDKRTLQISIPAELHLSPRIELPCREGLSKMKPSLD
jgi:hypothetical protein